MDAEDLTVKDLIVGLKVKQLWAIIGVIGSMIAASFAAGYKVSDISSEAHMTVQEIDLARGRADLDVLRKKDRFLSLFLRYEQRKSFDDRAAARDALDAYIGKFIADADKATSQVTVGKGSGVQTAITFSDGSIWTVPPDFRSATKD